MLMLNFALHFRKCINIVIQFYLSTPIPNQTFDNSFAIIFFFNFNRCQCNCTKYRPPFTRLHSFLLSQVSEFRNFDRWSCCVQHLGLCARQQKLLQDLEPQPLMGRPRQPAIFFIFVPNIFLCSRIGLFTFIVLLAPFYYVETNTKLEPFQHSRL